HNEEMLMRAQRSSGKEVAAAVQPADVIVAKVGDAWGEMVHRCTGLPFGAALQSSERASKIARAPRTSIEIPVSGVAGTIRAVLDPAVSGGSKIFLQADGGKSLEYPFSPWQSGSLRRAAEGLQKRAWGIVATPLDERGAVDYVVLSVIAIGGAVRASLGGKPQSQLHREIVPLRPGIDPGGRRFDVRVSLWTDSRNSVIALVKKGSIDMVMGEFHTFRFGALLSPREACQALHAELLKIAGHNGHGKGRKKGSRGSVRPSRAMAGAITH
ncbi:MAG: hypothetical protein DCC75_11340, partial [Proteobacteria bacterium]